MISTKKNKTKFKLTGTVVAYIFLDFSEMLSMNYLTGQNSQPETTHAVGNLNIIFDRKVAGTVPEQKISTNFNGVFVIYN